MNEMTGFSQNEIIGKYFYDLAAPQYLEILHEINRKRKTGLELSVSHELELLTKDGNTVPVETKLQPIVYKGKTAGMVIVHDISERKQAEKVLRQSEQNFRNSMDKSSIGIRISDKFGNNLYANQAMMDIFGYNNQDEIQAKQPQEYYTPECYASYLLRHEKFLRNEPMPKQIQINIIRKDGTIRNLQVSMMDVFWDSQPQYQTLYQDVTEFKRVEKELYESQEKYRLIVENSTDIIFTTDVHEQFAYVSPSVKEVLGYNPDELIGKPFIFFVHPEDAFIIREETKRTYNSDYKLSRDIECRMRHANGEWRWIVSKGTKLVDSCGDLIYFIGIMRDVTELKLMEKEKRELEDKAQVASRLAAVGEMAAGIAHEINNPLTGVLGFSQMLMEKENVPEEIKGDLKLIADGSRRVADIVKRLLTFARQTKPKKELTNINDLLNNTLKLREYVLNTANIKTITRFDSDLPWTVVDPGQMQQVFLNLIVNAEQAMRKAYGTGTLSISTEKKGNNIRVLFQDDGPGISKENLKRLFEPFFTTKEVGEGTGLGLSLSRSIVLDHGGDISVESEFGHGAAFTVEIPIVEETPIEADMKNKIIQKQPYLEKSGRILVIDDEPSIRVLLEKSLTLDGYLVDVVADAGAALNKLDAGGKYDILLLDMRMAGMNGAELYAHILEKVPALKGRTIIITGDVMGTDIKSFLIKNNLPYLAKPFDINLLKKQIDIIIESTPSGD
jgi:PAS domain S-box-containing protein